MRRFAHQAVRFFLSTLLGLTVDLVVYSLLVFAGLPAGLANVTSSAAAVVVVYFMATRYTFRSDGGPAKFALFVAWYAASIGFFSVLIEAGVTGMGLDPLVSKGLSLPLSFWANFLATRFLLRPSEGAADLKGTS